MNKKYIPFILTSLLLCGCVQEPTVTKENALEVAVDDSNVDMSEVISSEVNKTDDGFKVEFATESGKYTYMVGTDGLVKKRNYVSGETMETKEGTPEETPQENKEEKKEEAPKAETNTDEKKTRAENAALSNVGLSRDQATSITSELSADQTQYTVVIVSGDSRTTCVVNADSGEVVSTFFE